MHIIHDIIFKPTIYYTMKKYNCIILFLLLISVQSMGQYKYLISFSTGPSFPIGEFESQNPFVNTSGFAKNDMHYTVSLNISTSKIFGITALYSIQNFNTDYSNIYRYLNSLDKVSKANCTDGLWKTQSSLLGIYGNFPLSKNSHFEAKILAGIMHANSPQYLISYWRSDTYKTITENISSGSSNGFAYSFSGMLHFYFWKYFNFSTGLEYHHSQMDFDDSVIDSNINGVTPSYINQKIKFINLNFGLGIKI
jgi:hypothetical protein